jgi:hypothetical protein
MVIFYGQVVHVHLGLPGRKLDGHVALWDCHSPKRSCTVVVAAYRTDLGTETGIKVVNLRSFRLRRRRVDVESDEGESSRVNLPVGTLVQAVHEPQVRVPKQGVATVVRSRALDVGDADEAIEIGDCARLTPEAAAGVVRGTGLLEMNVRPAEARVEKPWNGQRPGAWHAAILQRFQERTGARPAPAHAPRGGS